MVQPADLRDGDAFAFGRMYTLTGHRAVAVERQVRTRFVLVFEVPAEDSHQMGCTKRDDVIRTFAADRTNKAFHERIPPRRLCSREDAAQIGSAARPESDSRASSVGSGRGSPDGLSGGRACLLITIANRAQTPAGANG